MNKALLSAAMTAAALALPVLPASAQTSEITIGISISTTGPAAALGIPERNALEFVPKEIGGVPLKVIVLDDGGEPTNATTNTRAVLSRSPRPTSSWDRRRRRRRLPFPTSPMKPAFPISGWRHFRSRRSA